MENFEDCHESEEREEYQSEYINLHEEDHAGIYSYTILGSDEIKPIQIIASCSSEKFRDAITDIDIEQLLLSMNKSLTDNI